MSRAKILLVEGIYDFHLIRNLLRHHGINCEEAAKSALTDTHSIDIVPKKGINDLLDSLELYLRQGDLQQIGLVVDANQELQNRWEQLRSRILTAGSTSLPVDFPMDSLHFVLSRLPQPDITVGIWIMPDNREKGYLEHFASLMIRHDDPLWVRAQNCVADIPVAIRPFTSLRQRKAELYTWLAWQAEPGKPMGLALTFQYLDAQAPMAQQFIQWAMAVFTT
jgi:hypothetical protein